jgi:hypothetical protein
MTRPFAPAGPSAESAARRKRLALQLSLSWAAAATQLSAAETRTAVPLPGLESDPAGTVVPESCTVSVIAGTVKVDLSASTAVEMPALLLSGAFFGWNGPSDPYPDRHFPELEIRVDGVPIKPEDRFEAFVGKTNITNLIKLAEMDPWAVTRTPPVTQAHAKNVQVLNGLKNVGAIEQSGEGYLVKWSVRRLLRIPLRAVPVQRLELDYTARPASSLMTAEQLDTTSREKSYCISPKQLRPLMRPEEFSTWLTVNEFSISTGIDGKSPLSVILTMSPNPGGDAKPPASPNTGRNARSPTYLFFCGPHGKPIARKASVTRERVEVDDQGTVHVLSVAAAGRPE